MPTGYSFNLDGSTLYLSLAAIFVAQAAGIELSIGQQFVLLLTLMLSSKGVAGVPRGALVILLGTVSSFGLPAEPVFVILGIDAVLDMLRTSVNVLGNCLATVVIARWEGEFPRVTQSSPCKQPGGVERWQWRIRVVHDQRDLRAAEDHGITALAFIRSMTR